MLFNSLTFLVFFGLVLGLDRTLASGRSRKILLLVASYLFYAAWNPPFVILLWISTLVDWKVAAWLHEENRPRRRRALVLVSLGVNLGLLGFFKYGSFLLDNFVALLGAMGLSFQAAESSIVLPVGISFYTFQTLSYTLDVYHRRARPASSALDFALYVTFFPQLVAGPIVRATDFIPQCEQPRRASSKDLGWGLFLLTLGLFEKVVLADVLLAGTADKVFGWERGPLAGLDAFFGTLAFSSQIFCDFAGYSTAAIGVALCLGFRLPDNFRFPYAAVGLRDFWRRWHISLSTWLRDYLYVPLGGNRRSSRRTSVNLMITMLLGGLWHGAAWTFVAWGGLHGLYLMAERLLARRWGDRAWVRSTPGRIGLGALTYLLVCVTWVFFRAKSFGQAGLLLGAMVGIVPGGAKVLLGRDLLITGIVTLIVLGTHAFMRTREDRLDKVVGALPAPLIGLGWAAMLISLILAQGGGDAFIYFQF